MAATVQIVEKNGAGGTQTDKTSGTIRFKNADNATVDTGNPMVKPGAGVGMGRDHTLFAKAAGTVEFTLLASSPSNDELQAYEEGCLSVPDYYDEVERPKRVKLRYLNYKGEQVEEWAEGMYAVCIQHEMDHLDGVLYIEKAAEVFAEKEPEIHE